MANATQGVNPYAGPKAAVAEPTEGYQPVKLFSISGRIGRVRYLVYGTGMYILIAIAAAALAAVIGTAAMVVMWIALLTIWFMLAMQRSHDFNTTGWLSILVLVPLVNLIFLFIPGTDGPNNYGPPPPPNSTRVIIAAWAVPVGIVLIGILAAIAIPAYQDYQKRAQQKMQIQQQQQPSR
jgi:uncharacterized membrane protein YhaH (DUF805 family)